MSYQTNNNLMNKDISKDWLLNNLPVFIQPKIDVENGNILLGVQVIPENDNNKINLRIFYYGESSYNRKNKYLLNQVGTWVYKLHNFIRYGRTIDINTLTFICKTKEWDDIFTPDYCGLQNWNNGHRAQFLWNYSFFHHYSESFSEKIWERFPKTNRPIIFVNTCNHLHGPINMNPDMDMHIWDNYPVYYQNKYLNWIK